MAGAKKRSDGRSRVYPLVKTDSSDVVAAAVAEMKRRGWDAIEEGAVIRTLGTFTEVALWAAPPAREEVSA